MPGERGQFRQDASNTACDRSCNPANSGNYDGLMMITIGQREAGTQLTPVGQAPKVAVDSVRGHERPGFDCDDVKYRGGGECQ